LAGFAAKGIRADDVCPDVEEEEEEEEVDEDEDEDDDDNDDNDKHMNECVGNKELVAICRAMANSSTEHLIDVVLGGGTSDCEFFTNGLGLNALSEGPLVMTGRAKLE
jgi:predicted phage tail protein